MELEKKWGEYSKAEQDEIFAYYFKWVRSKARANIQAHWNVALKYIDTFHLEGFELVKRAFETYDPQHGSFKNYVWQNLHRRFAAVWNRISNEFEAETAWKEGRDIDRDRNKKQEDPGPDEEFKTPIEISSPAHSENCTEKSMEDILDLEKNKVIVRWVNDVMARKGFREWFVWLMHQNHELSFKEIAEIIGASKTTASNIFHKANEKAQEIFEECLDGYATVQRCAEKQGTDITEHVSNIVDSPGEVKIMFSKWYPSKSAIAMLEYDTKNKSSIGSIFKIGCKKISILRFNLKESF